MNHLAAFLIGVFLSQSGGGGVFQRVDNWQGLIELGDGFQVLDCWEIPESITVSGYKTESPLLYTGNASMMEEDIICLSPSLILGIPPCYAQGNRSIVVLYDIYSVSRYAAVGRDESTRLHLLGFCEGILLIRLEILSSSNEYKCYLFRITGDWGIEDGHAGVTGWRGMGK